MITTAAAPRAVRFSLPHFLALCTAPQLLLSLLQPPAADSSVKLEVGIEDCLHIEFEYDRTRYHLGDVVTGRVNFLLVKIRIKYMELAVIRREAAGQGERILPV